ncbi:helix-turn-helix transcriptional regulator [Fusobacterium necrophorum subsp. funduliforme]|nr:helix-turn-helix transcriptional regulator [Fusobacterium necrophorum]AYV94361.1 XRE family transcriptional regulator [Fusobacterium necrophorum subsp. funduliforme]KYL04290.1 transcriptional regulator [Fusobacterium necrophorum subsp. funduliforme]KYM51125.1 transcriptional regulator [Fusobacterium necrophorum subsp. funduliforme]MDK4472382.1 helix-turn-helix transcriptional regulator [Fusobacterium necrophorum]MDK4518977.1 helix-turn-helix transcriptional regulator [Fusobacterium necropho
MLKNKIKYLMADYNIRTISELSRQTGISRDTLNKIYENARTETVTLDMFLKLCKLFNCKLSDLIEYFPDEQPLD